MKTIILILVVLLLGLIIFNVFSIEFAVHKITQSKTPPYMKGFYVCMPVNNKIILDSRCS